MALTLQQALLPSELPPADGVELAVRYLAATAGTEAGGDFYEAIELPAGRLGLAVGDVVGHGPAAAAAMGQLRSALRAYALEGRGPARVLQLLSRCADGVTGARGATIVYAVVDPPTGEVRYACAGHPPPLVIGPDGDTRFLLGGRGVPLDRTLAHRYEEAVERIEPGTTLVLFSDGAVERRGESLDLGFARIAAAADAALDPEALCGRILEVMFADAERRDDVALLAARVGHPAVAPLRLRLPADVDELQAMRAALRAWLGRVVGPADADLVVLAAGELATNAIEHAYDGQPGEVEVELSRDREGTLTLLVRDSGRWRPPEPDRAGPPALRRRGLAIVRALMHAVDVDDGASGTSVSARFQPGPAGAAAALAGSHGPAVVEAERRSETSIARVSGELDMAVADDVAARLQALGSGPLVVDLSGVGFLGSAGLRVLFALAGRPGGVAVVAPPGAACRRSLAVAELHRALPVADTMDEALARLGGSP